MKRAFLTVASLLFLLATLLFSPAASADSIAVAIEDPPLVPAALPSGVSLKAYIYESNVSEGNLVCSQDLIIHSDGTTYITLILPAAENPSAVQAVPNLWVNQQAVAAGESASWTIGLVPGDTLVRLECTFPIGDASVIDWKTRTDLLTGWGVPESITVRLGYSVTADDGAFLITIPHGQAFDGVEFFWSYEQVMAPAHHVAMIAPATWRTLRAAEEQQDHATIALSLDKIIQSSSAMGIPQDHLVERLTGEFLSIIEQNPDDISARLGLGEIWLSKSNEEEVDQLNYLLLAAEQFEQAKQIDTSIDLDSTLAEIYYRAAIQLSQAGDPTAALHYMEHSQNLGGLLLEQGEARALYIEWLAQLASLGQTDVAINESRELLSESEYAQLLEYAPPFRSIRVEAQTKETTCLTILQFSPYEPVLEQTHSELLLLADILNQVPRVDATTSPLPLLTITVTQKLDSLIDLAETNGAIRDAMPAPPTLLATAVASAFPISTSTQPYDDQPLQRSSVISEQLSTKELAEAWATATQYAAWRESEVRSTNLSAESISPETKLLGRVLSDEQAVWQLAPTISYWRHSLDIPGYDETSALLAWDEEAVLESTNTEKNTVQLWVLAAGTLAILMLVAYWTVRRLETVAQ